MKSLFAAAALTLAFAASAQAQAVTATLATSLPKPRRIVLDTTVWDCRDNQCQVVVGPEADSWQACRLLARAIGPVTAYTTLDEAKLARCNGAK